MLPPTNLYSIDNNETYELIPCKLTHKVLLLGHIPKLIRSSATHAIKPKDILPRRVEKNKLHRYSKVFMSLFKIALIDCIFLNSSLTYLKLILCVHLSDVSQ